MKKIILPVIITAISFHTAIAQCRTRVLVNVSGDMTISTCNTGLSVPPNTTTSIEVPTATPAEVGVSVSTGATLSVPAANLTILIISVIQPTLVYINGVIWPVSMEPLPTNGRMFNLSLVSGGKISIKREDVREGNQFVKKTVLRVTSANAVMKEIKPGVIKSN